eukprot:1677416-Amphidinium_carterae.1
MVKGLAASQEGHVSQLVGDVLQNVQSMSRALYSMPNLYRHASRDKVVAFAQKFAPRCDPVTGRTAARWHGALSERRTSKVEWLALFGLRPKMKQGPFCCESYEVSGLGVICDAAQDDFGLPVCV